MSEGNAHIAEMPAEYKVRNAWVDFQAENNLHPSPPPASAVLMYQMGYRNARAEQSETMQILRNALEESTRVLRDCISPQMYGELIRRNRNLLQDVTEQIWPENCTWSFTIPDEGIDYWRTECGEHVPDKDMGGGWAYCPYCRGYIVKEGA